MFTWTAVDIIQAVLFFFKYRMNLESQSDMIAGAVFFVALVALPFWSWASQHWDKRLAYIAGVVFLSVVHRVHHRSQSQLGSRARCWACRAGWDRRRSGPRAALVHHTRRHRMGRLATGQRHEGMFYSLVTLMHKVASSIAIPLALLMLDLTGYVSNAPAQSARRHPRHPGAHGADPGRPILRGILFAMFYPLDRNRHAQVRAQLALRKAEISPGDS